MVSISSDVNKWFLIASGASYLIPVAVVVYNLFKPRGRRLNTFIAVELIAVFLFVTVFTSPSYHSCRAGLAIKENIDPDEMEIHGDAGINGCLTCPPNTMSWVRHVPMSTKELTYDLSKTYDHIFAMFALLLATINVIPLKQNFKQLIIILSLLWMALFLGSGNDIIAGIPVMIVTGLFVAFWIAVRKNISCKRNVAWGLGIFCVILGFVCFALEPYWLMHSMWHIMGAVAGALFLAQTAGCYESIHGSFTLPKYMRLLFKRPEACTVFDV